MKNFVAEKRLNQTQFCFAVKKAEERKKSAGNGLPAPTSLSSDQTQISASVANGIKFFSAAGDVLFSQA